ncbi:hypothetical protein [Christiangramia sabulilitoris]|uniref:Uncharacterized protein n=1 Tax=Christiangramia sabulilitoris TaxID=2583991 RepID=A0A550I2V5_9FLAO|nr:hypothetical protein [Christiangramia sabulilitoris]TRO65148.1 hypothetical protein FGM01_07000 [Christiangramia sabulilitoris]
MRLKLLFIFLLVGTLGQAQEYWDRKDFEISNRGIDNTWREFSFNWQQQSNFNLPDGSFLHLRNEFQKEEIDMLAVIDKSNRNRVKQQINLGSPLPLQKPKEKKLFELTGEVKVRDANDSFMNPFYPSPFLNNFNRRSYNTRIYSPYRYSN